MSQAQVRKIDIYEFGPQRLVPWLFEALERPDGLSSDTLSNLRQLLQTHGRSPSDIHILKSFDYKNLISQLSEEDFKLFIESQLGNATVEDLLLQGQPLNCANLRAWLLSHFSRFPFPEIGPQIALEEAFREVQEAQSALDFYTQLTNPLDFNECIQIIHKSIDRALVLLEKFNDIVIIFLSEVAHELVGCSDDDYKEWLSKVSKERWLDKIKLIEDISKKIKERLSQCDRISGNHKNYLYEFLFLSIEEISTQLDQIRCCRNSIRHPTRTLTSGIAVPKEYHDQVKKLVQALNQLREGLNKLQQIPLLGVICRVGTDIYGRQEVEIAAENNQFIKIVFTNINIFSNIKNFESCHGKICFFMSDIDQNKPKLNNIMVVLYNDKAVRHLLPEAFELDLRIPKEAPPPSEEVDIDAETQAFVP